MDGLSDQLIDQGLIAAQNIQPGAAQAQGMGNQLVLVVVQQPAQKNRMIVRHQPRVMHGPGKPVGFLLESGQIHYPQPVAIDLQPRIVQTGLGGAKQGGDQPVGPQPGLTDIPSLLGQGQGDLGDHGLDMIDLDGPLGQDPPDFLDQAAQDILKADMLQQIAI